MLGGYVTASNPVLVASSGQVQVSTSGFFVMQFNE